MKIDKYLERIGFKDHLTADVKCLKNLHRCHIMSIPFEALNIQWKRKISLAERDIYHKVINEQRGGYCYELNFLFHQLLTQIGFDCVIISAKVYDNGIYGPEFDHMSIIVNLDKLYLVDVGFGDLFIEPIAIHNPDIQEDQFKYYKVEKRNDDQFVVLESLKHHLDFQTKYKFNLTPRRIADFSEQNIYKQTSPESHFVKNTICTLATPHGRKTIRNNVFKVRNGDQVEERDILSQDDFEKILENEFKMSIPT